MDKFSDHKFVNLIPYHFQYLDRESIEQCNPTGRVYDVSIHVGKVTSKPRTATSSS